MNWMWRLLVVAWSACAWLAPAARRPRTARQNFLESWGRRERPPPPEAAELFEATAAAWRAGRKPDAARCSALVDALAARRCDFDASSLGGGLWLTLYTRGPAPKWQANAELVPFVRNRVGQAYDVATGRVRNYGEVLGRAVSFVAEGSFDAPRGPRAAPVDVAVAIDGGGLTLFGTRIDLPIKGPGLLRVLYADDAVRVFESPTDAPDKWEESGLVVVQVRETLLAQGD